MGPVLENGTLVLENEKPFDKVVDHSAPAETPAHPETQEQGEAERKMQSQLLEASVEETIRRTQQALMSEEVKFKHQQRIASLFAQSGYFEDLKGGDPRQNIARAVVKIQLGEALGLSPMESMQSVYMVNGRPTVDAQVRAARMKRCGYSWDILRHDTKGCTLAPRFKGEQIMRQKHVAGVPQFDKDGSPVMEPVTVSFTEEDAKSADLLGKRGEMYKKYPMNMYFSRALTNMQRWYAPEVLNGSNLLSPDEAIEVVDSTVPAKPLFTKHTEPAQ